MADAGEESAMFTLTEARLRALALARTGHRKEAIAILEAGVATARDRGQPYDEALMLDAVAETIEPDDPAVAGESRVEAERIMRTLGVRV